MTRPTDTERLSWLLARGAYDYVQECSRCDGTGVVEGER